MREDIRPTPEQKSHAKRMRSQLEALQEQIKTDGRSSLLGEHYEGNNNDNKNSYMEFKDKMQAQKLDLGFFINSNAWVNVGSIGE